MRQLIVANFEHTLCILILIGRLGDIISTRLVTPKLELEANPIVRKLGWPFAFATVLICLIPYWSTAAGVVVLIPSLFVSATNTSKIWFARALWRKRVSRIDPGDGEKEQALLRFGWDRCFGTFHCACWIRSIVSLPGSSHELGLLDRVWNFAICLYCSFLWQPVFH